MLQDLVVVKRSGQRVPFNETKIALAIKRAFESIYEDSNEKDVNLLLEKVLTEIRENYDERKTINVENIQDIIENNLNTEKYKEVYNSFSEYRLRRAASREAFAIKEQHKFVKAIEKIGYAAKSVNDKKANELKENFAKTISKEFATSYLIENKILRGCEEGSIYINDLKDYTIGNICSANLNIRNLEGDTVSTYIDNLIKLITLAINDLYGEICISELDSNLNVKVINEFKRVFLDNLYSMFKVNNLSDYITYESLESSLNLVTTIDSEIIDKIIVNNNLKRVYEIAFNKTMENLKYTLDTNFKKLFLLLNVVIQNSNNKVVLTLKNNDDYINNLIVKSYLENVVKSEKIVTNVFLNNENTKSYVIDTIKRGVGVNLICSELENVDYFSNGELVYDNVNDEEKTSIGRTINNECTINLARIALKNDSLDDFYNELDYILELNKNALISRFDIQASKFKENYNVVFDTGYLFESEKLENFQKVRKIIRNGALVVGFAGLVEACLILNKSEGLKITENEIKLMENILEHMNYKVQEMTKRFKLNFVLAEVLDETILTNFIKIDKMVYGIKKVINKEAYEPVYKYIKDASEYKKYQTLTSSVLVLKIENDAKDVKIEKLLNKIKENNVNYSRIEIKNDY